ncbi:glutamate receptor 2-like isoform X2 [Glandiceps talaboti]
MGSYLIYITMVTICLSSVSNCIAEEVEAHYARLRRQATPNPPSQKTSTLSNPSTTTRDTLGTPTTESRPKLIITTIQEPPFLKLVDEEVTGNNEYEGYIADLVSLLAYKLDFDYELSLVPDGRYGSDDGEGNWTGMIGQLVKREVDMAAAPLTISYRREQVVDFTKPFMNAGLQALLKKPTSGKDGNLFTFLFPFTVEVWICIIVAFVVVGVVLFLLSRFSPYEWRALSKRDEVTNAEGKHFNCLNSFWFTFSTLTLQGYHNSPRSIATRFLSGFWFFFIIVILFAYLSNLASFMTVTRATSTPIQSFDELSRQYYVGYGTLDHGATQSFFRDSKYEMFERMGSFMDSNPTFLVKSVQEGVERVIQSSGTYAFIGESTFLEYVVNQVCSLYVTSETVVLRSYGLAFPLNDSRTASFSVALSQLRDDGTLQMLQDKWWRTTGQCGKTSSEQYGKKPMYASAITLVDISGIFIILLIGIVLSIPLLLCEWVFYNSKQKPVEPEVPKSDSGAQTESTGVMV